VTRKTLISCLVVVLAGRMALGQAKDAQPPLQRAPYGAPVIAGKIVHPAVREASGLAPSRRHRDVLWLINDSGNPPVLYAVGTNGVARGEYRVKGAQNRDWEDLASFRLGGVPYLMVADVGDNSAKHGTCTLYIVREPDVVREAPKKSKTLPLSWTVRFRYEDGPRDCESVAVHAASRRILLLSKRTRPPVLYELPLRRGDAKDVATARRLAEIANIPPPTKEDLKDRQGRYSSQPTAMDMASDGTAIAVLTYRHAYLYHRRGKEPWAQACARRPLRLVLPSRNTGLLRQREALCFAHGSQRLFITSEGHPAPLCRVDPKRRRASE
jgi:hypothetical protein